MSHENETIWVDEIGRGAEDSICELVEGITCPFNRENTSEEEAREAWEDSGEVDAWEGRPAQWEEALSILNHAEGSRGYCDRVEAAEERIREDALSVEVRSDWTSSGEKMTPAEFAIEIATGGPAVRIRGELDRHGEPDRAWLEVQDWFKPWTEYHGPNPSDLAAACLTYARCFCWEVTR
ncbi:MAG: hypothetical protein EBX65_00230 [Betaproteobacteria bacterium]|nr:hypothetical protein [Betaproteobacteria bacterium]